MRAISRTAEPHTEAQLLELALQATAAQLERIVRTYRRGLSVEEAHDQRRERHLSCSWDDDGSLVIRGRLPAEEGELLLKALEAARADAAEPEDVDNVSAETSDRPTRRVRGQADALVAVADSALAASEIGRTGGDRYQLIIHADADSFGREAAALEGGGTICPATVERVACDASLVRTRERDGRPLNVGRKTRTIPPSVRRALRSRDRCCLFPGCTNHRFVDAHHIHHWAHGGETKLSNLVLLCRRHHRLLHEGGYGMEGRPGGALRFTRPDGRTIAPESRRTRVHHQVLTRGNAQAGLAIGPETAVALSNGDRFSLDLTVGGLLELNANFAVAEDRGVSAERGIRLTAPEFPRRT